MVCEILQEMFEEWDQKIAATMSAMMSASIYTTFSKFVKEEITDMGENTLKSLKVLKQIHLLQKF